MSITELICMATNVKPALEQPPQRASDWSLVAVLSMTAGAVDLSDFSDSEGCLSRTSLEISWWWSPIT
jgi:hypothetical protein